MTRRQELLGVLLALAVAYFALVVAFVLLFTLNATVIKSDAAKQAATATCLASRPTRLNFERHLQRLDRMMGVRPYKFHIPTVAECKDL